jgi:DNA repair exonuclease SbcCD nuclease subunit
MERTRSVNRTPSAILTADWHLTESTPVCRTDAYWDAEWKKVDYISMLQKTYNCPVLMSGDLFDGWKPSPNLLRETILHLPDQLHLVYGNHDLPAHNISLVDKCGINVLQAAEKLTVLSTCHFNQTPTEPSLVIKGRKILVWHVMNYQSKLPWPGCEAPMAAKLLRKFPDYDLILSGDNHKTFHEELDGRHLVNPGSLMRMDADQIDHKPCVWFWFAEDNAVEQVFIPIEQGVISREHLERKEERDARIDAFVSRLDTEWVADVSFEQNLEQFEKTNQIRKSVMEIVFKSLETKI